MLFINKDNINETRLIFSQMNRSLLMNRVKKSTNRTKKNINSSY